MGWFSSCQTWSFPNWIDPSLFHQLLKLTKSSILLFNTALRLYVLRMHYETCGGVWRRCGEVKRQIRTAGLECVYKSTFLRLNRFNFRTNVHHNLDRNPGNVCLKNRPGIRENFARKIEIRKTTQGIGNSTKAWNPESKFHLQGL